MGDARTAMKNFATVERWFERPAADRASRSSLSADRPRGCSPVRGGGHCGRIYQPAPSNGGRMIFVSRRSVGADPHSADARGEPFIPGWPAVRPGPAGRRAERLRGLRSSGPHTNNDRMRRTSRRASSRARRGMVDYRSGRGWSTDWYDAADGPRQSQARDASSDRDLSTSVVARIVAPPCGRGIVKEHGDAAQRHRQA